MGEKKKDYYIPRSGPMPRPESIEQARIALKEESFNAPNCQEVTFETKEFTSVCPKTGQPDYAEVEITYIPDEKCIESKSLKFYLWSFRDYGGYSEQIASKIVDDIVFAINPKIVTVIVKQNIRGGLSLNAIAERIQEE